jgi:hypothetical protein
LDVGVYVLNFAHMVFGPERVPQKIHAASSIGVMEREKFARGREKTHCGGDSAIKTREKEKEG